MFSENDAFYGELKTGSVLDGAHVFEVDARGEFYDIYSGEYFESAALPCKLVFQQEAENGLVPSLAQIAAELGEELK